MDIVQFLRQFRIGPFAVFDTAISYLAIYLLSPTLTRGMRAFRIHVSRAGWLWFMLPASVLIHGLFQQRTPLMNQLFNPDTFFIAPVILVFMTYMGIKECTYRASK